MSLYSDPLKTLRVIANACRAGLGRTGVDARPYMTIAQS